MRPIEVSEVEYDDPVEVSNVMAVNEVLVMQNEHNLSQHSIPSVEENKSENEDLKKPVRFNSSPKQIIQNQIAKAGQEFNSPRHSKPDNQIVPVINKSCSNDLKDRDMIVENSPEQAQE